MALSLLGPGLQTARRFFLDHAPAAECRRQLYPLLGVLSSQSRDYIFGVDPCTLQRVCPADTSATAIFSGYPQYLPNMPPDHGGNDVLVVATAAHHSGQRSPMFTEQGSCIITSVVAMDDTLLSSETKITVTPPPCSSVARPACIPGTAWPYNFESHAYVIPSEAMQHTELLGRYSWVRSKRPLLLCTVGPRPGYVRALGNFTLPPSR